MPEHVPSDLLRRVCGDNVPVASSTQRYRNVIAGNSVFHSTPGILDMPQAQFLYGTVETMRPGQEIRRAPKKLIDNGL